MRPPAPRRCDRRGPRGGAGPTAAPRVRGLGLSLEVEAGAFARSRLASCAPEAPALAQVAPRDCSLLRHTRGSGAYGRTQFHTLAHVRTQKVGREILGSEADRRLCRRGPTVWGGG